MYLTRLDWKISISPVATIRYDSSLMENESDISIQSENCPKRDGKLKRVRWARTGLGVSKCGHATLYSGRARKKEVTGNWDWSGFMFRNYGNNCFGSFAADLIDWYKIYTTECSSITSIERQPTVAFKISLGLKTNHENTYTESRSIPLSRCVSMCRAATCWSPWTWNFSSDRKHAQPNIRRRSEMAELDQYVLGENIIKS